MDKTPNIYNDTLRLDVLCFDIIEGARDYYAELPPNSLMTRREQVEHWVENWLHPALECAIDDTFEED